MCCVPCKWYRQLEVAAASVINNVQTVLGLVGKWYTDLESVDTHNLDHLVQFPVVVHRLLMV